MLNKSLSLLAGALMLAAVASCKYDKTENGLQYKIVKDSTGEDYPEEGGVMAFWYEIRTENDSLIETLFGKPNPAVIPIMEVKHTPSIEEGLMLLTKGDSAVFLINADSLYTNSFGAPRPKYFAEGSNVKMIVKMVEVYSKHFADSARAAHAREMELFESMQNEIYKKDSTMIQDYLKKNKLKGEPTIGGAYVVKLKTNTATDLFIGPGEPVETKYLGKLLADGTKFDESAPGEYFKFNVGTQQVIPGWDQAFLKLKHGEKALILIPSRLAYQDRPAGKIPPNSPLLFEVEVK